MPKVLICPKVDKVLTVLIMLKESTMSKVSKETRIRLGEENSTFTKNSNVSLVS